MRIEDGGTRCYKREDPDAKRRQTWEPEDVAYEDQLSGERKQDQTEAGKCAEGTHRLQDERGSN